MTGISQALRWPSRPHEPHQGVSDDEYRHYRATAEYRANLLLDAELHLQDTIGDYLRALRDRNALVERFGGTPGHGGSSCAL